MTALQPGASTPDFELPGVNRDGTVALHDFRGTNPLLVGLFRGLHCPFCQRQLASLNVVHEQLKGAGIETVAIVNSEPERARFYFRHRPTRVVLAADPARATHQAFGLPTTEFTENETDWPAKVSMPDLMATRINPTGELPEPMPAFEANQALNVRDGFAMTESDEKILGTFGAHAAGHFLLDRDGVVRWTHVEATEGLADIGKFPSAQDLLGAAMALRG